MRNADFLEKGTSGLLKESHGSGGGQSAYRQEDPKKERQYLHTGFQAIFSTFDEGIVYGDFFPYTPYEDDGDEQWQECYG